jgi:hypothetical protein
MNNLEVKKDGVEVARNAACSKGNRVQALDKFGLGAMQATARESRCAWKSPERE